jgi:hypothetical protein
MLTTLLLSLVVFAGTLLLGLALLPALLLQSVLGRAPSMDEVEEEVGDRWATPFPTSSPFAESMG